MVHKTQGPNGDISLATARCLAEESQNHWADSPEILCFYFQNSFVPLFYVIEVLGFTKHSDYS